MERRVASARVVQRRLAEAGRLVWMEVPHSQTVVRRARTAAQSTAPPIPGLYHLHSLLPLDLLHSLALDISSSNAFAAHSNQSMFFTSLPHYLSPLLETLPTLLLPLIPSALHTLLFDSPLSRQAIMNLYHPGEGITPHVDLPTRYADGILGLSLLSSTVLDFYLAGEWKYSLRLRPGDIYILSGAARNDWEHGIEGRMEDTVMGEEGEGDRTVRRGTRISLTLRRMKEGAEVVGGDEALER
jgi:hypothetical protein